MGDQKGGRPVWMLAVPLYLGGWFASSACTQILSPTPPSFTPLPPSPTAVVAYEISTADKT